MTISRRTALRQAFIIAGGTIFLQGCLHHSDRSDLVLHHLRMSGDQQDTLEALADALIPGGSLASNTDPGAKAVAAHLFVMKMIDDCYPEIQQKKFIKGLEAFDQQARQQYGRRFSDCDREQKEALVSALDGSVFPEDYTAGKQPVSKEDDLSFFYREHKKLVIRGYLGSQYFLTKVEIYELVPGRWHGCTPLIKKS